MTKQFRIVPEIYLFNNCQEFADAFSIGERDLILTNPTYYHGYMDRFCGEANVFFLKNYGTGEPTDVMVEALYEDVRQVTYDRVIAIGGGSIIDVAKLLVQETVAPLEKLFDKEIPTKKVKKLVVVPTTCGTGSEVTSVSVIDMTGKGTKLGLQTDEEYADAAVLIPELAAHIPFRFFAASSIDALVHAVESYLSPKATAFSEMFSIKAIETILSGYCEIAAATDKEQKKQALIGEFLLASTYAGIAFGNAGCAAVHAMSLPFSGAHHVPHGEANYALFTGVLKAYYRLCPDEKIQKLNELLSHLLKCSQVQVYDGLDELLGQILVKRPLHEYGVEKEELKRYTQTVLTKQGRLTANNYTTLDETEILHIYEQLF